MTPPCQGPCGPHHPARMNRTAPSMRTPSERQRPALRELVHLEARHLRVRAAAVGVADQKRPAADRPGEAARRVGELPGAAGHRPTPLNTPRASTTLLTTVRAFVSGTAVTWL